MLRVAVIRFPGSNCDFDTLHSAARAGTEAYMVWHRDTDLQGADAVMLPGGFSYGDYLRSGAIARFSPIMQAVQRFALEGGPVLGPVQGASYERGFVTMGPGDLLVLTTDGILETENPPKKGVREEFGTDRLVEVARQNRDRPAAEIVGAIFEAVEKFSGNRAAKDDRTVVVVRYPPG